MSNLLQLQNGYKTFGSKVIFENAAFSVNEGEHVGVIGPNGAGKTTLFKILTDQEHLNNGTLVKAKTLRLGYLAQHDHWGPEETVEDYLSASLIPIWDLKSLGRKLGITEDMYSKKIMSLSGGYRMRCKLLFLIGQEPNLMLLDEPTNYLDLETTLVLENFLQGYKGAFLLISHDREFLRRTTDHILEVEQGEITKFNGNIDDYFEQKQMLREQLEARAMSLEEKRKNVLDFVARFGAKATKARQAQSRLKSLDRMEKIEIKALPVKAKIKIPPPFKTGKSIVSLKDVQLGYGEKVVLRNVNLIVERGDHVGVVGLNGAGKSTLLKALAQKLEPLKGQVELGFGVKVGYYAQHVAEGVDPSSTVIDEMMKYAHPEVKYQEALDMAGSLLFSGDDVKKKISVLSGGEKSRVALGQILLQKNPCLLLDEPTNHLDFQTVEALTQALQEYEGSVIVVSHDRGFIGRIGTKILEINQGQAHFYPGSYEEYVWSLEKGVLSERDLLEVMAEGKNPAPAKPKEPNAREVRKNLGKQMKQLERAINDVEKKLETSQQRMNILNDQIAAGTCESLPDAIKELGELQITTAKLEEEWLSLTEQIDSLEASKT
jgi:ATP-binding cassette subfamily F protein 3